MTTRADDTRGDTEPDPGEPDTVTVEVDARLHDAARLIADLRGERVEDVVARALKSYAQGRRRPRE